MLAHLSSFFYALLIPWGIFVRKGNWVPIISLFLTSGACPNQDDQTSTNGFIHARNQIENCFVCLGGPGAGGVQVVSKRTFWVPPLTSPAFVNFGCLSKSDTILL